VSKRCLEYYGVKERKKQAQFWSAIEFACPVFFEEKPLFDADMCSSRK
jgi:hypothetical protein